MDSPHEMSQEDGQVGALADQVASLTWGLARRLRQEGGAQADLSLSQLAAMSHLDRLGEATGAQLARAERVTPQSMSAVITGLRAAGLVESVACGQDGRQRPLRLSAQGQAALAAVQHRRTQWLRGLLATQLTAAERATLAEAIHLLGRATDVSGP